jgi:hypothetical protein
MNWLQLAYQYTIGGLLFATTMIGCLRLGAIDRRVPSDRWIVRILVLGFVGYFAFHLSWIMLASR